MQVTTLLLTATPFWRLFSPLIAVRNTDRRFNLSQSIRTLHKDVSLKSDCSEFQHFLLTTSHNATNNNDLKQNFLNCLSPDSQAPPCGVNYAVHVISMSTSAASFLLNIFSGSLILVLKVINIINPYWSLMLYFWFDQKGSSLRMRSDQRQIWHKSREIGQGSVHYPSVSAQLPYFHRKSHGCTETARLPLLKKEKIMKPKQSTKLSV